MPNAKNIQQVAMLKEKIAKAKSLAIFDYSGTNANDQVKLRSEVTQVGGEVIVSKNTLISLALEKKELESSLTGMNAIVFSYEDAVGALKKLFAFKKETEKLNIKQGLMEDKVLSADEVKALSQLPGKDELMSMFLNVLQSPARGMVNVLKAGTRDLVYVLKAVANKK